MKVSRRTAPSRWQCSSTLGISLKKALWAGVTTRPVRASGTLPGFMSASSWQERNGGRLSSSIGCPAMKTIAIVMGVSGSGKTTVAAMLAGALGVAFLEGDDLHPRANVEKMRSGKPLSDEDRWPWLRAIAARIDQWRAEGKAGVVTCSALKRVYR